jgi:hypothetical protein
MAGTAYPAWVALGSSARSSRSVMASQRACCRLTRCCSAAAATCSTGSPKRDREPAQRVRAWDAPLALDLAGPLPGRATVAALGDSDQAQAAGDLGQPQAPAAPLGGDQLGQGPAVGRVVREQAVAGRWPQPRRCCQRCQARDGGAGDGLLDQRGQLLGAQHHPALGSGCRCRDRLGRGRSAARVPVAVGLTGTLTDTLTGGLTDSR